MTEPPATTRAYFRGECLARWPDAVVAANWDSVILDVGSDPLRRIPMMEPLRGTKAHVEPLFAEVRDPGRTGRTTPGVSERRLPCPSVSESRSRRPRSGSKKRSSVAAPAKQGEELKEELDDLLDEIDSVLEANAEEVRKKLRTKRRGVKLSTGRRCHTPSVQFGRETLQEVR